MGVGDECKSAARRTVSKSAERKKVSKSAASKTGRSALERDSRRTDTGGHRSFRIDTATGTDTGGHGMDECSSSDDRASGTTDMGDSELSDGTRVRLDESARHAVEHSASRSRVRAAKSSTTAPTEDARGPDRLIDHWANNRNELPQTAYSERSSHNTVFRDPGITAGSREWTAQKRASAPDELSEANTAIPSSGSNAGSTASPTES